MLHTMINIPRLTTRSNIESYTQGKKRLPDEGRRVHGRNVVTHEHVDEKNSPTMLHKMINIPCLTKFRQKYIDMCI